MLRGFILVLFFASSLPHMGQCQAMFMEFLLGESHKSYDGAIVTEGDSTRFEYDAAFDSLPSLKAELLNKGRGAWIDTLKEEYFYNGLGLLDTQINSFFDGSNWHAWRRTNILYNSDAQVVERIRENWTSSSWQNSFKVTYAYDGSGNRTLLRFETWTGSVWQYAWDYIYTYDAANNEISETQRQFVGGAWQNISRFQQTFDLRGNRTSFTSFSWTSGSWNSDYAFVYAYDTADNLLLEANINTDSSWDTLFVDYFEYNVDQTLTQKLSKRKMGGILEKEELVNYTLDNMNRDSVAAYSNWIAGAWQLDRRILKSFNSYGDVLVRQVQNYSSGGFENVYRDYYLYTLGGALLQRTYQSWDGAWKNQGRWIYRFTDDGNAEVEIYEGWEGSWERIWKQHYEYKSVFVGVYEIPQSSGTTVSPNPSSGLIKLEGANLWNSYRLWTLEGSLLHSGIISQNKQSMRLQNFSSGLFILELSGNTGSQSIPILLY